jgi:hypothetical protein
MRGLIPLTPPHGQNHTTDSNDITEKYWVLTKPQTGPSSVDQVIEKQ